MTCYHYSGPCYPCVLTADVSCFCGATKVTVLCGKQKSTKPPRCREPCTLPSACHHPHRQAHSCHFGVCPPCSLPCSLPLPCGHLCSQRCHSEPHPPARKQGQAPWMKVDPAEKVVDPCPPCMQLVQRYVQYVCSMLILEKNTPFLYTCNVLFNHAVWSNELYCCSGHVVEVTKSTIYPVVSHMTTHVSESVAGC